MRIITTYILKQFLYTLIFSIFALCVIFLIVNLLENLDNFMDQDADIEIILKYYLYFFPEILKVLTPVAMLISVLFSVGKLSQANEIIAMKSGGMSLYRLMLPLLIFSIMMSFGQLYFNGWIVPAANIHKLKIEQVYLQKKVSGGPIFNLYFRDDPFTNVIMQYYDSDAKLGNNVSINKYKLDPHPRLIERYDASRILWDSANSQWKLTNGIHRSIINDKLQTVRFDTATISLNIKHEQIIQLQRETDEMTFEEFRDYIELLRQGGKDVRQLLVEYHGNYAFPFANLIVVLFAVPFASIRKKGGLAIQIAAAMIISFLYLVFTKIGQTIGIAMDMNPIIAGWLANIVFLIGGIFNIYKTRT